MSLEDEINKAMSDLNNQSQANPELNGQTQPPAQEPIFTPENLARSLQPISRMVSRRTDIKSIELTDDDVKDLGNALEPFKDQLVKLITLVPFLPLFLFSIGYSIRIYIEYRDKKKLKANKKASLPVEKIEEPKKQETENKSIPNPPLS